MSFYTDTASSYILHDDSTASGLRVSICKMDYPESSMTERADAEQRNFRCSKPVQYRIITI
jgi:hypothetical protein